MEPITNPVIFDEYYRPPLLYRTLKHIDRSKLVPLPKEKKSKSAIKNTCPFFMVDGIEIESQDATPINTNSGVLIEEDLKKLM